VFILDLTLPNKIKKTLFNVPTKKFCNESVRHANFDIQEDTADKTG